MKDWRGRIVHDDLIDANYAVLWAIAQLPILQDRIKAWGDGSRHHVISEADPKEGKKFFKLTNVKPLDPMINAEAGAIIGSIRSSLDILITAIAKRHGWTSDKDTYFPIAKSRSHFIKGDYKGNEAINILSQRERSIIENLEPWRGGNHILIALHDLDILRKHQRLVNVQFNYSFFPPIGGELLKGLTLTSTNWPTLEGETIIGWTDISAPDCDFHIIVHVLFNEGSFGVSRHLIGTLHQFCRLADDIIMLFN